MKLSEDVPGKDIPIIGQKMDMKKAATLVSNWKCFDHPSGCDCVRKAANMLGQGAANLLQIAKEQKDACDRSVSYGEELVGLLDHCKNALHIAISKDMTISRSEVLGLIERINFAIVPENTEGNA